MLRIRKAVTVGFLSSVWVGGAASLWAADDVGVPAVSLEPASQNLLPDGALPALEGTLIVDIGGTRARFLIASGEKTFDPGWEKNVSVWACEKFDSLDALLVAAIQETAPVGMRVTEVRLAVAAPIVPGEMRLTNISRWSAFSIETLSVRLKNLLGYPVRVHLMNDVEAIALSLPLLMTQEGGLKNLSETRKTDNTKDAVGASPQKLDPTSGPVLVVSCGTGVGAAAVMPVRACGAVSWTTMPTEAGHASLGFETMEQKKVQMRIKPWPVSIESVLSGQGLVHIYQAFCRINRATLPETSAFKEGAHLSAEVVLKRAQEGDLNARRAIGLYARFLGMACQSLALSFKTHTLCLTGGAFTGIAKSPYFRMSSLLHVNDQSYKPAILKFLKTLRLYQIHNPYPALLGLAYMKGIDVVAQTRSAPQS